jgi:hypothetical protein
MKNLNILYHLQEVPSLQIPDILYPYTGGQIFQELKFPHTHDQQFSNKKSFNPFPHICNNTTFIKMLTFD